MKTDAVRKTKLTTSVLYDGHNLFNSRPLANFSFAVTFLLPPQASLSSPRVSHAGSAPSGILTTSRLQSARATKTKLFLPRRTSARRQTLNHLIYQHLGNFSFAVSNATAENSFSSGLPRSGFALNRSKNLPVDTGATFHQYIRIR